MQFGLGRSQCAASHCSEKPGKRRIVMLQSAPACVSVLARKRLMHVGELDLLRKFVRTQRVQPRQLPAHTFDCGRTRLPALLENRFSLFSEKLEIGGLGHSTTSIVARVRTAGRRFVVIK